MPSVSQTSVIFFGLLVGFIVFITVRGELAQYLFVIGLEGHAGAGTLGGPGYYDPVLRKTAIILNDTLKPIGSQPR